MRQDFFEFVPSWKIWYATNHRPVIRGTDKAIWNRIKLVPFTVTIPLAEQNSHLEEDLLEELPGILNWALTGCLEWQAHRLGEPVEVSSATANYRAEMDLLAHFFDDCCQLVPSGKAIKADLYTRYVGWSKDNGERYETQRAFSLHMKERGFADHRGAQGSWMWLGVELLPVDPAGVSKSIGVHRPVTQQVTQVTLGDTESTIDNRGSLYRGLTGNPRHLTSHVTPGTPLCLECGAAVVRGMVLCDDCVQKRNDSGLSMSAPESGTLASPPASESPVSPLGRIKPAKINIGLYEAWVRQGVPDAEARERARVNQENNDE